MNAPVYVNIDQGIHKVKLKVAQNEKQKKITWVFFPINKANFEAFPRNKKLSTNLTRTYLVPSLNTQIEL